MTHGMDDNTQMIREDMDENLSNFNKGTDYLKDQMNTFEQQVRNARNNENDNSVEEEYEQRDDQEEQI